MPLWGTSNEYPQHMFLWRTKKISVNFGQKGTKKAMWDHCSQCIINFCFLCSFMACFNLNKHHSLFQFRLPQNLPMLIYRHQDKQKSCFSASTLTMFSDYHWSYHGSLSAFEHSSNILVQFQEAFFSTEWWMSWNRNSSLKTWTC